MTADDHNTRVLADFKEQSREYLRRRALRLETTEEQDLAHVLRVRHVLDNLRGMTMDEKFDAGNRITAEILREQGTLPGTTRH